MYCIKCGNNITKVLDSRVSEEGNSIRRRRECGNCNNRFTTYEKIEVLKLLVLKAGDKKEKYSREKVEESILKATNKRKISIFRIEDLIKNLELKWQNKKEISSKDIGNDVLDSLLLIDEVAYIRYASVHLNFETTKDFLYFINNKFK